MPPRSIVAATALVLGVLATGAWSAPQVSKLSSMVSGGKGTESVEASVVVETAARSFEAWGERLLALGDGRQGGAPEGIAALDEARRRELVDEASQRFRGELERAASTLEGDGILLASEVRTRFGQLREEAVDRLSSVATAIAGGHRPPPVPEAFDGRWAYRTDLARYIFLERNSWVDWGLLLGLALGGVVVGNTALRLTRRGAKGGGVSRALRVVLDGIDGPFYLAITAAAGRIGLEFVWLPAEVEGPARLAITGTFLIALFWLSWRLSNSVPRRLGRWILPHDDEPGRQVLEILRSAIRLAIMALFAFLAAEVLFDTDFTTLLAGLGVIGLGVTLAAQDTLKDFFAAITLYSNRPFSLGDLVRFQGYLGTIEEIGFRMTRLRTFDGHLVAIPNAKLVSEPVENIDARPSVRRRFRLELPRSMGAEQLERAVELVRETVEATAELDPQTEIQVHFDEFGAWGHRLLVQYYHATDEYWPAKAADTKVDVALVEAFGREGLELAFPTQDVRVRRADPEEEARADGRAVGEEVDHDEPEGSATTRGAEEGDAGEGEDA